MNMKVLFCGGAHFFVHSVLCSGEKSGWNRQKWGDETQEEFSSSSQVDHEKSHLALARWNVVLWRFTFFRAIEETDFQMITTDYFNVMIAENSLFFPVLIKVHNCPDSHCSKNNGYQH